MSAKPEHYGELTRLISALLDGQLGAEERARLELLLESDPSARRLYLQMVDQEIELECLVVPVSAGRGIVPIPVAAESPSLRRWWWSLAAAAIVALLLVLWPGREPVPEQRQAGHAADTSWAADFETGSAFGWTGEFVSAGLPAGSKGGIRAVATQIPEGVIYKIAPPEDWGAGFAGLTETSTLHITYRLGAATWVNVFLHTIEPGGALPSMFQLMGSGFPGAAGQWQTASIPFKRFQRKVWDDAAGQMTFTGGGPRDEERIALLFFSAPHPIDLVIDRISITPGGSGGETIIPLQ